MHNLIYTRQKRKGFSKLWGAVRGVAFTNCYGFLKSRRGQAGRQRINLMYHRRERGSIV
jgi:hypothetical protein